MSSVLPFSSVPLARALMSGPQSDPMKKVVMVALLTAWTTAGAAGYEMKSYVTVGGKTQEAFAWCDAPNRVFAVPQVSGELTKPQPASLVTWLKTVRGGPNIDTIQLGAGDGAAGSVYYPLSASGQKTNGGDYVRLSNVENVLDPAYRMSRVSAFKVANKEYACRYVPQAAFLGVTAQRTVIVWDNGKTATYATRNFDGSAGVYVTGGRRIPPGMEGGTHYEFSAPGGITYSVNIDANGPKTGASVIVRQDGHLEPGQPFLAYSVSLPKK